MTYAKEGKSAVIPAMRYVDAHAAIAWLERVLGFVVQAVYDDGSGGVAHAQLTFGTGMVMISSVKPGTVWSQSMALPAELAGKNTATIVLISSDATAVYEQAKAAGAEMAAELETMDYGGKAFACKDPEGYLWSIGDYDPWA